MDSELGEPTPRDKACCAVLDAALSNRCFAVEKVFGSHKTFAIYVTQHDGGMTDHCLFIWKDPKRAQMNSVLSIDARMALRIIKANWENRVEEVTAK